MTSLPEDIQRATHEIRQSHKSVDKFSPPDLKEVIIVTLTDYLNLDAELKNIEQFVKAACMKQPKQRELEDVRHLPSLAWKIYRDRYVDTVNSVNLRASREPYQLDPDHIEVLMDRLHRLVHDYIDRLSNNRHTT